MKLPVVIILMIVLMTATHAAVQPNVIVSSFSTQGDASVGKDFNLQLTLSNTEPASCAVSTTTTLQANTPFIMRGISTQQVGQLCSSNTKTISFPLHVDPTATGGFYQVTVVNTYETSLLSQYTSSSTINLFVNATPELSATIVNSNPLEVYAGDTATLTLNIENVGSFEAQSVTATLIADAPLEVKQFQSSTSLGTLAAKQGRTAEFSVEVPKNAAAKDYPMTLHVQYTDESSAQQARDIPLVFHVEKKAIFVTSDVGSDKLYANDNSKIVRLMLKNTGTDSAYKIKARIAPQFPFSTDGSVRYIDQLDPGKSAPIELVVNVDKDGTTGQYGLDMILDFEDAQGKSLQDTTKVALAVEHKSIFRAVFVDYWVAWIIAVVIAFIVIRKKGKKK